LSIILPPILAATTIVFSLFGVSSIPISFSATALSRFAIFYFFAVIYAFVFSGVQAIVAALILEYLVRSRVTTRFQFVIAAGALGGLSGFTVFFALFSPTLLVIGVAAGVMTGIVLLKNLHIENCSTNTSKQVVENSCEG